MDETYAWATTRLGTCGYPAVAERLASRGRDPDRTAICKAVGAAIDRVDLRRAAALDHAHAVQWIAIHQDQAEVVRTQLAFCRTQDVRA